MADHKIRFDFLSATNMNKAVSRIAASCNQLDVSDVSEVFMP
jgi:hypothetical protein